MAEVLLYNENNTHPDPEMDRIGCYKRGMVVVAKSDGFDWGGVAKDPRFIIIKFPGVEESVFDKYLEPQYAVTPEIEPPVYRLRKWVVRIDDILPETRQLLSQRPVTVGTSKHSGPADFDWSTQVKLFVRNLLTGADETVDL